MGASLKNLRARIKGVGSTLHLTSAMGLVASSKLRRAQLEREKSLEYAHSIASVIDAICALHECKSSVYMQEGRGKKDVIIVIAGDRGLAGGYNVNVLRYARTLEGELIPIGKKACEGCNGSRSSSERFSYDDAQELATELCERFKGGELRRVGVLYTKYISMISQEVTLEWLLPLKEGSGSATGAILEPDALTVLEGATPVFLAGTIYSFVRDSFACEIVSRRSAMDNASKNARAIIDDLQVRYNRARQGAITQQITEIIAGGE